MCRNFVPFGTGHGTFLQGQVLWIGLAKGQVKSEACSTDLLMITSGNYLDGQFAIAQRGRDVGTGNASIFGDVLRETHI
jgi:hypothetical protein